MEVILKDGMKVIAPNGCCDNLTEGKEYEVFNVNNSCPEYIFNFNIISDEKEELYCLFNHCAHLLGGNWIIKTESK